MEDYEFEITKKQLRKRVKFIRDNPKMSEEEKKQKLSSLARQWTALKREFKKGLPEKEHYDRTEANSELKELKKEFEDR